MKGNVNKIFGAAVIAIVMSGCGGGGASNSAQQDTGSPIGNSNLGGGNNLTSEGSNGGVQSGYRLKFIGNIDSRKPVEGVTVSLYTNNSHVPTQTLVTDASGMADFSNVSAKSATIIYGFETTKNDTVTIAALVDYAPSYLEILTNRDPLEVAAIVDVVFDGENSGAMVGSLQPIFTGAVSSIDAQTASFKDVQVLELGVQTDGLVSFLAQASGPGPATRYGFVLDQQLQTGQTYTATFDQSYESFSWEATLPVQSVGQSLYRKGVQFASLGGNAVTGQQGQQMGISNFPADIQVFSASAVSTENGFTERRIKQIMADSFPDRIMVFDFSDFYLTDVVRQEQPGSYSISWLKNGSGPATIFSYIDSRHVYAEGNQAQVQKIYNLSVSADPNKRMFEFPELQGDLARWFGEFQGVNSQSRIAALWYYPKQRNFEESSKSIPGCYDSLFKDENCIKEGFFQDVYQQTL